MFAHIFINRLKCITRSKETMFWTLLFPIMLSTLFYMAFSNLSSDEMFTRINIAVVDSPEYQSDLAFKSSLEGVSKPGADKNEEGMFNTTVTTMDEADKLLADNKIVGYIYFDKGIKLVVKESGFNQTILKSFIEDFLETSSTVTTIMEQNQGVNPGKLISDTADRSNYMKAVSASRSAPDNTVNYFYSLLAMTCLYGGFMGLREVSDVQADLTAQGARVNIAPVHKLKIFGYSLCAATAVQLLSILAVLAYIGMVLKVDFGDRLGYILLTCIVGCFTGVSLGAMVGAVVKKGEGIKVGVLIGLSMALSFFSGMMVLDIKYIVKEKVPLLSYINPSNLITDAFYSLYYYDNLSRYFINISLLTMFSVLFYIMTYFVLRRQKYASI